MRFLLKACVLICCLFLSACDEAEPTLNTANGQALQTSIVRMAEQVPTSDRDIFQKALILLSMPDDQSDVGILGVLSALAYSTPEQMAADLSEYQGWTLEEIIHAAEEKRRKQIDHQIADIDKRIDDVRDEKNLQASEIAATQAVLDKIQLVNSSFHWSDKNSGFFASISRPTVNVTFINNADFSVASVHFEATITSAGREVPWVKETLRYSLPGGIEPGEKYDMEAEQWGGGWSSVPTEETSNLVLSVKLVGLKDGLDNFYSAERPESSFPDNREALLIEERSELEQRRSEDVFMPALPPKH